MAIFDEMADRCMKDAIPIGPVGPLTWPQPSVGA